MRKRRLPAILLVGMLLLAACGESGRGDGQIPLAGSRVQPLRAGETAVYEGMDTNTEYGSFRLKLQLRDAVRGEAAMRIYLADDSTNRDTDIPQDKEIVLVNMSAKLLESRDDTPLQLGMWAEGMFLMVAELGETYRPLSDYGQLRQNRFGVLAPGEEQVGLLGFVVDRTDRAPTVVFLPEVGGGIWFNPAVEEYERERDRIDPGEWGLDEDIYDDFSLPGMIPEAADPDFGGTTANPLPPGEWGVYRIEGDSSVLELELMVLAVERGEQALLRLGADAGDLMEQFDALTEEVLAVQMRANLLEDGWGSGVYLNHTGFLLLSESGEFSVGERGPQNATQGSMLPMFEGATQEGWAFFVVGRDEHLLLSPRFGADTALWFTTDPEASLPDELLRFESRYVPEMAYARDSSAQKGSLANPLQVGERGRYHSGEWEIWGEGYEVEIEMLRVLRGDDAAEYLDAFGALFHQPPAGKELLCVQLDVTLLYSENDEWMHFAGDAFRIVSSQRIVGDPALPADEVRDGLNALSPGQNAQGNLLFYVDEDDPTPLLSFPSGFSALAPPIWFELTAYGPAQSI